LLFHPFFFNKKALKSTKKGEKQSKKRENIDVSSQEIANFEAQNSRT
jgi:hypothetical protein